MENIATIKNKILARPLDIALKCLQDYEIQYTIKATEPQSRKFELSDEYYCLNAVFTTAHICEVIVARKQTGLAISSVKGGVI